MSSPIDRRNFLKFMGGAGAMGMAAFTGARLSGAPVQTTGSAGHPGMNQDATPEPGSYQEMDLHHQQGVETFLANAGQEADFWRQEPLAFTMDGDVKVFDITVSELDWETAPGMSFPRNGLQWSRSRPWAPSASPKGIVSVST
ncbi:MAG: hypothetical protein U0694_18665 [Anaerolineae bacterium]